MEDAGSKMLMAFSSQQACQLTGLTTRQLTYWDKQNFFRPELYSDHGRPFGRIYSFRDVVGLRTISQLRETVSHQHLRKLGEWLRENLGEVEAPWSQLRFYIVGRRVMFGHPDSDEVVGSEPLGQMVFCVLIMDVAKEVRTRIDRLQKRPADAVGQIKQSKHVLQNRPILAGTRIPTSATWDFHSAGYTTDQILSEYPDLALADVENAIEYERSREKKRIA